MDNTLTRRQIEIMSREDALKLTVDAVRQHLSATGATVVTSKMLFEINEQLSKDNSRYARFFDHISLTRFNKQVIEELNRKE